MTRGSREREEAIEKGLYRIRLKYPPADWDRLWAIVDDELAKHNLRIEQMMIDYGEKGVFPQGQFYYGFFPSLIQQYRS